MNRRWLLAVLTVALGACGNSTGPSVPTPNRRLAHFSTSDGTVSFDYPATWKQAAYTQVGTFSSSITYLSTEPLRNACSATGCNGETAVRNLSPNGVLVSWSETSFPFLAPGQSGLSSAPGQPTTVAGRAAKLHIGGLDGACPHISAQEVFSVVIAGSGPYNWFTMSACLRGPDLGSLEGEIKAMLKSTQLTARLTPR